MTPNISLRSAHKTPKTLKTLRGCSKGDDLDPIAFEVARQIKSDQRAGGDLRDATRLYYDHLKLTQDFDEFALAVDYAYHLVRVKIGESPLLEAIRSDFPSPIDDRCPLTRRLAGCVRFFHQKHGGRPFPLSGATASQLLGHHRTPANRAIGRRVIQRLIRLGVLELHKKGRHDTGGASGEASTYRYVLPEREPGLRLATG